MNKDIKNTDAPLGGMVLRFYVQDEIKEAEIRDIVQSLGAVIATTGRSRSVTLTIFDHETPESWSDAIKNGAPVVSPAWVYE